MTREVAQESPAPKLWNRDFTRLWWSEAVSFFGSQLTLFALPIVALQNLRASTSEVAWISTAAGVGTLVFLGLLGPWTDRGRRTRLMALLSAVRAVLVAIVALLFVSGQLTLPVLIVVAGLIAGLTGLYDSAFAALLPGITHRSRLPKANSWVAGIRSAGDIGAGATAGILLQLFSPFALFIADACSYVVSAIAVRTIREAKPEPPPRLSVRAYGASLGDGFRILYRSSVMWPVNLAIAHFNLFTATIQAVYIAHAVRSGSMTAAEIGVAGAAGGVLGLASTVIAPRVWEWARPLGVLSVTFALPAVAGLGMLLLGPGQPVVNVALLALSLGLWASSVMINITGTETLKQVFIPSESLGSVSAASRIMTWGVDPLGAALAGVLAVFLPTGAVLVVAVVGVAASPLWVLVNRTIRGLPLLAQAAP
jgi:MFS family permease